MFQLPAKIPGLLLLLFSACITFQAKATHIVGGDLGYRYLGETAPGTGEYRYKVILRLFVNCGPSSSFPSVINIVGSPTDGLPLGVYADDPTAPNADKARLATAQLYVTSYGVITPDLADDCSLGDGQCVEESRLEGEVVLAGSTTGFHLYLQLFARNQSIDNLVNPGGTGMGFYSYVPPTSVVNSSPVFTGTPVPYICIGDTTAFSNAAIDSNGDSLVFSFEIPYDSQDDVGGVAAPPFTLQWPLEPVQFSAGHSAQAPFGSSGSASIVPSTGATQYAPTIIGNWVVAVEVKEYRNGQLIGVIRSDLQLLSVPCSGTNVAPMPLNGVLTTHYQVIAGEELCFTLDFVDSDGDLVTADVIGGIFEGSLTAPPAVHAGPVSGDSLLSTQICWATSCDQGGGDPFYFTVLAYDDACPPGTYSATITIDVLPVLAPPSISGLGIGCSGQTTTAYCTDLVEDATYAWTVSGGTIESAADSNCIVVAWGVPGIGEVTVQRSIDGCVMETTQPINILAAIPASFSITTDTTCLGMRVRAFDTSADAVASTWTVNGVPVQTGVSGSEFLLPFSGTSTIGLASTAANGCVGQAEQVVDVAAYSELVDFSLPNVFTPNRDGVNDRFKLKTTQVIDPCFKLQVYDRWGNLVHESDGGNEGWNGNQQNGEPASAGVYYYVVSVHEETFHGHLSLMR